MFTFISHILSSLSWLSSSLVHVHSLFLYCKKFQLTASISKRGRELILWFSTLCYHLPSAKHGVTHHVALVFSLGLVSFPSLPVIRVGMNGNAQRKWLSPQRAHKVVAGYIVVTLQNTFWKKPQWVAQTYCGHIANKIVKEPRVSFKMCPVAALERTL